MNNKLRAITVSCVINKNKTKSSFKRKRIRGGQKEERRKKRKKEKVGRRREGEWKEGRGEI